MNIVSKYLTGRDIFSTSLVRRGEGDGEFNCPSFLSVTQSKHLLVCDGYNHRIQVFELNGNFIGKFGKKGSKLGEFLAPYAVAVGSNDQIVVSEGYNHRIQIFEWLR